MSRTQASVVRSCIFTCQLLVGRSVPLLPHISENALVRSDYQDRLAQPSSDMTLLHCSWFNLVQGLFTPTWPIYAPLSARRSPLVVGPSTPVPTSTNLDCEMSHQACHSATAPSLSQQPPPYSKLPLRHIAPEPVTVTTSITLARHLCFNMADDGTRD
jgi:hypothetical protein